MKAKHFAGRSAKATTSRCRNTDRTQPLVPHRRRRAAHNDIGADTRIIRCRLGDALQESSEQSDLFTRRNPITRRGQSDSVANLFVTSVCATAWEIRGLPCAVRSARHVKNIGSRVLVDTCDAMSKHKVSVCFDCDLRRRNDVRAVQERSAEETAG